MKKQVSIILSAVLCISMLVGCGVSSAAAAAKTSATLATAGEPLKYFHLSPTGCSGDDNLVLSNIYDCLTFLEPNGTLSPGLAERWEVSNDGLVYTMYLRRGVKFHDGTDLTAEDVKFSLELGRDGPLGGALLINFVSCEIVDDYTVNLILHTPFAAFLNGVASRVGGIVSKAYYERVGDDGYMNAPIGTGPYKYVSSVSGDHVLLEAFDDYWRGTPPIKNIYIKTMIDASTQIIALENGDVDAVRNPAIAVCTRLDEARGVTWKHESSTGRITINLSAWGGSALEDKNVRKAIQSAINKEDVNIGVNEGYGVVLDIDMGVAYSGRPTGYMVVPHDIDKAKEYLAASGYTNQEVVLVTAVGTTLETAARIVQAQLIEIGINCTVTAVDNATYMELWTSANYDGIVFDHLSSLVDADSFRPVFNVPETGWPYSQHSQYERTREIYNLLMQGSAVMGDARLPFYREAVDIATEEVYLVPLYNGVVTVAHRTDLKGVEAHCLGTYNFFRWSWE